MSRIYDLLRQAERERRAAAPAVPRAAVDRQQPLAAASVADLDETGHEKVLRLQAILATANLLGKIRQPLISELTPARSAQLFTSLVSLHRQAADLELEMDDVLASVAHHARALTRADAAAVALLQDNHVVCRGRTGLKAPALGTRVNLRSSFTGQSFCAREVLYCEDTRNDPRVNQTACSVAGIRSILVVPVVQDQQSIGIIEIFSASPARFGTSEGRALELLACLVADALRVRDAVDPSPRSHNSN
jgi:GAF domain-containing protein